MSTNAEWEALRRRLEKEKDAVAAEIQAYPRPIAGCDAQFNHLLEHRRLLWEELSRLEVARCDRTASVGGFLQNSTCLDQEAKRSILAALEPVEGGRA